MTYTRKLRFGLWYDFRNPARWGQDPATLYQGILGQIARAEALGWDDVWLSEHHFVDDGYTPSPLVLASAIAARTSTMRIGTAVLLLPLHDPVRVAEDAASIDIVSNGRFDLGVGLGYARFEFDGFGVPYVERAGRLEEGARILQRLFAGERFGFEGQYLRRGQMALYPRPVQQPMPLWMGGFSERAVRRIARLGANYLGAGPVQPLIELYRRELAAHGRNPVEYEVAGGIQWLLVSRDPARRWREAADHFLYQHNLYARWSQEAGQNLMAPVASAEELRAHGVTIVEPEQAVTLIGDYVRTTGVTRYFSWTLPTGLPPEWSDEHVELMAREVMPALR